MDSDPIGSLAGRVVSVFETVGKRPIGSGGATGTPVPFEP